jgi:hypothetical protein
MNMRLGQGSVLGVLIGALAALAVLAPGAAAKPPKAFYGVTPQVELGSYELERMGQGRMGTLRVSFSWSAIDNTPIPGDSDFALYDQLVGSAAQAGIRILPVFDNVPKWVADLDGCQADCYRYAPRSTVTRLAWRGFIRSVVQRYGPEGTYWAEHPEVKPKPIRAWQIWNEQNSAQYFAPEPDVDVYAELLTEASKVIKEEDPGAEVVLGGMFLSPGGKDDENSSFRYLRRLYGHTGVSNHFDGVAVHPYAGSMKNVRLQVDLMRDVMKNAGDQRTGLWVTEVGWSSSEGSYYLEVGPKRQASLLRKSFGYFTRQRRPLHIKSVIWFSWRDTPPTVELCVWCPTSGLFTRDGFTPKPAWRAFTRFTGGE